MSNESATLCHCPRNEVATFCGRHISRTPTTKEDKVTHAVMLALVIIPEDQENLRRGLERDDGLEGIKIVSEGGHRSDVRLTLTARFVWFGS